MKIYILFIKINILLLQYHYIKLEFMYLLNMVYIVSFLFLLFDDEHDYINFIIIITIIKY